MSVYGIFASEGSRSGWHFSIAAWAAICSAGHLILHLAALLLIQLPFSEPEKAAEGDPCLWAPEALGEAWVKLLASSWPNLSHCSHWGMNQRVKDTSPLNPTFSLKLCFSNIFMYEVDAEEARTPYVVAVQLTLLSSMNCPSLPQSVCRFGCFALRGLQ